MNISLTPALEQYIKNKVATGLYNNSSEVIREALRALLEREGRQVTAYGKAPARGEILARLGTLEKPLRDRGVRSLAVFGSVARDTAHRDSDVDVLVDTEPGARFSLVDLAAVTELLAERLHHKVDVVTMAGLEPGIRERVLSEAVSVF